MTRHPRADRCDAICRALLASPDRDTVWIATRCSMGQSLTAKYCAELERDGVIVSRLETVAEAHARRDTTSRSVFTRPTARRRLRYTLVAQQREAA